MNSIKNRQKLAKISHALSTCIIMLSVRVQHQGKAGFFKLNFQFSNSQNTGKCKLGRYLLRHAVTIGMSIGKPAIGGQQWSLFS